MRTAPLPAFGLSASALCSRCGGCQAAPLVVTASVPSASQLECWHAALLRPRAVGARRISGSIVLLSPPTRGWSLRELTKMKTTEIWGSPSEGGACLHLRGQRSALGRAADAGPAAGRRGQLYILRPSEEWQRRHRRSTRDPGKDPAVAVPGPNPPSPGPRRAPPPVRWSSPAGTAPSRFLGGLGRGGRAKRSPRGQWGSLGGRAGARVSPRRPAQSAQDGRQPPVPHAAGAVPEGTGCPGWWSPNVQ